MLLYAVQVGPVTLIPLWLALHDRSHSRHWLWVLPLALLYTVFVVSAESVNGWQPRYHSSAAFLGIVLGTVAAVASNAAALHVLGLTWKQRSAAASVATAGAGGNSPKSDIL